MINYFLSLEPKPISQFKGNEFSEALKQGSLVKESLLITDFELLVYVTKAPASQNNYKPHKYVKKSKRNSVKPPYNLVKIKNNGNFIIN